MFPNFLKEPKLIYTSRDKRHDNKSTFNKLPMVLFGTAAAAAAKSNHIRSL